MFVVVSFVDLVHFGSSEEIGWLLFVVVQSVVVAVVFVALPCLADS